MKRVHRRSAVLLVLVFLLIGGLGYFLFQYVTQGGQWVGFAANRHLYQNGKMVGAGRVLDRSGEYWLSYPNENGRQYNSDPTIRRATLHAVGDLQGNIATGALRMFSDKLSGYNMVTGVYGLNGKGNDLYLTIDAEVCAAAYKALDGRSGAVGVYNYKTGDILAMVSSKGFDPTDPPTITEENADQYEGIYVNRFFSSTFTPGSVFKLVTTAAALDCLPDVESRTFTCTGKTNIGGETITCPKAHGTLTFEQALAVSCNTTYAQLATEIGGSNLYTYAESAGLLSRLDVDGILTAAGRYDYAEATEGELAWSGIGQYHDLVNPCSFLYYMGSVANGGRAAKPRIISKLTTSGGFPLSIQMTANGERTLSASTASRLKDMMRYNVENNYGDGNYPGLTLCAKSGTAEVGGGKEPHAWFAGFCANEKYPLAFVVVLENGGAGSSKAGPVANQVLQAAAKVLDREGE